jgi:four helix bundle protein
MVNQEVPLFSKIYELSKKLYQINKKLPKRDRYVLGAKIENSSSDLLKFVISATSSKSENKLTYLENANTELEFLKILIRLANDNNLYKSKQYLELQEILQETGRMLGGWIRYQNRL